MKEQMSKQNLNWKNYSSFNIFAYDNVKLYLNIIEKYAHVAKITVFESVLLIFVVATSR